MHTHPPHPHTHQVSSQGASASAAVTYLKTKGRIEDALKALGFERLILYRPAALVGGDRDVSTRESTNARAHTYTLSVFR